MTKQTQTIGNSYKVKKDKWSVCAGGVGRGGGRSKTIRSLENCCLCRGPRCHRAAYCIMAGHEAGSDHTMMPHCPMGGRLEERSLEPGGVGGGVI